MSDKVKEYNKIFYAIKREEEFVHFYDSLKLVKFCDSGKGPYVKVKIREAKKDEKSDYVCWGWKDYKDRKYQFIYPEQFQVEMCFPYGTELAEERGEGKLVKIIVEELGKIK